MDSRRWILAAVAVATFLDTLIFGIIIPILPVYSENLGATPFTLGVIFAAYSASLLAGTIPLGLLSDRYGRKKIMLLGLLTLSLSTLGFTLANSLWLLILIRLIQGFSAGATWTAGPALVADLYPPDQRGAKMGIISAATGFGFLIGPAAGGLLYELGGYRLPFLIGTILSLIVGLFVLKVLPADKTNGKSRKRDHSLLEVLQFKGVPVSLTVILLGSTGFGFIDPILPGYFMDKFGISPGIVGILFGLISLSHVSSAPVIGKLSDSWGRLKLIQWGLVGTAAVIPLVSLSNSLITTAMVMGLLGITFGLILTPTMPLLADSVMLQSKDSGEASYGAAFGLYNTAFSLGYLLGPLFGGGWMEFLPLWGLFALYSLLLLTLFLFTLPRNKKEIRGLQ
ncbi:MFS transporter [Desulforamulus ruminis]|uniref:MFS transporter n=1 Tax=Desulforamulus ruminis TaxID=1564 RepID=UPI002354253E|nr:MFS transporter [Desulforamulus ruminis]